MTIDQFCDTAQMHNIGFWVESDNVFTYWTTNPPNYKVGEEIWFNATSDFKEEGNWAQIYDFRPYKITAINHVIRIDKDSVYHELNIYLEDKANAES